MPAAEKPKRTGFLSTPRQIIYFTFFILWCCIDVSCLGLVSEQINKFGNEAANYPSAEYYHALGLLLFATIIGLIYGIFHAWVGLKITIVIFVAFGVFFGTGAGILEQTPFGHGLQCGKPIHTFPANFQPFVSQCTRVTAISALAWAMFGLALIGFFWVIADTFEFTTKRSVIYEPADLEKGEAVAH